MPPGQPQGIGPQPASGSQAETGRADEELRANLMAFHSPMPEAD